MGIDSCGMIISAVDERNGEEELPVVMLDNHIPAGAKMCYNVQRFDINIVENMFANVLFDTKLTSIRVCSVIHG